MDLTIFSQDNVRWLSSNGLVDYSKLDRYGLTSNLALIIGLIHNFTGKKEVELGKIEEMLVT